MKKFLPNLVYLLLNLPLGVLYFTILVAGFSLGIGLSITLIGLPILFAMIFITYLLGDFDRLITAKLLGLQIAKPEARPSNKETITAILASQLKRRVLEAVRLFIAENAAWDHFFYSGNHIRKCQPGIDRYTHRSKQRSRRAVHALERVSDYIHP